MILTEFPDLDWLKAQANTRFSDRRGVNGIKLKNEGWPTIVLNTKANRALRDNIPGPLSIFTNISGTSHVTADKKRVAITSDTFFISNNKQHYTLEVNGEVPVETFNIHFGEHFSKNALQCLFLSAGEMLENESLQNRENFGFHNRLIRSSEEFKSIVYAIKINGKDKLFLDEKLFQLVSILFGEQEKVLSMQSKLLAVKSSTREEILRRLMTVTDYIFTFYTHNPDLDELSQISCLSKFHFLRLFKLAYGQTPHQFITTLKIEKAKQLLKGKSDIGTIAHQLGFDTASTFSRTFFNNVGVYPSRFVWY